MKQSIIASLVSASLASVAFNASTFADEAASLDDTIVTASRTSESLSKTLADVSVIDRAQIERAGQSSLVEILQTQPGIEITNTGGAGKSSGIFMRGTNTSHVLVLVDGVRFNSATTGTTAFENLPVALIDRIEILRGPAASLYGQDAIGGVIQIFTKKGSGKPQFYASVGYGTYDTKTAEAGVHGTINDTSFAFGISSQDTDGFSALKTNNPNLKDDDGYSNLSITSSLSHKISEDDEIGLQLLHSKGKTRFDNRYNIDPFSPAFDPAFSDYAEITQQSYSVYTKNKITSNWTSTLRVGEGDDETVTYAALGPFTSESRSLFRTKQHQLTWLNDVKLPVGVLTLAYDRLEERVKSTTDFKENSRNNDGYFAGYLADLGNHTIHLNYRSDHNTRFGTNDTGGVSYGYQLTDSWRASASYGTAFRAPTFNDLYYPDFFGFAQANPNLKPEKSESIEASLRYNRDKTTASVTVYQNKIRDLIVFTSIPENVRKAEIQGVTVAASQAWDSWLLQGSVDIQSPRDESTDNLLIRRANNHASASLGYTLGDWHFGAEGIASSKRYNDTANNISLAGYTIFNLTTDYQINQDWKIQARLNNMFDKQYALAYDGNPRTDGFAYDTPGSNLFVSVRWQPK
ncbi:TonB-dependent receptor domain-containing protein [Methylotenera versatilis]|uniref:TonB-dependent receptor domain-containing protein n=1 Tax=Methylotenera versatilis TaxID=1055487 RepID=UPI0006483864|nr:TonB-dependent receptor [Methylotenera versatilis]